jgi:hypothetical protein
MVARDGSGASSGKRHFVIVSEPDPKDAPVENDALNAGLKAFNHVPGRYNLGGRYTSRRIAPVDEDDADVDDEDTDEGQDDPTDEDDDGEDDEDYDSDEDVGMADGEDDEDYDSDEDVGMADGEDEGPENVSVNDHLHFHFAPLSLFPCSFPPLVPQRPRLPWQGMRLSPSLKQNTRIPISCSCFFTAQRTPTHSLPNPAVLWTSAVAIHVTLFTIAFPPFMRHHH